MTKYYMVIKETPAWTIGAIISNEKSEKGNYSSIEDAWDNVEFGEDGYCELAEVIENSPKFFKRVYKSKADKLLFLTKEQFKKAFKMVEA